MFSFSFPSLTLFLSRLHHRPQWVNLAGQCILLQAWVSAPGSVHWFYQSWLQHSKLLVWRCTNPLWIAKKGQSLLKNRVITNIAAATMQCSVLSSRLSHTHARTHARTFTHTHTRAHVLCWSCVTQSKLCHWNQYKIPFPNWCDGSAGPGWAYRVGQSDFKAVKECDACFCWANFNPPDEVRFYWYLLSNVNLKLPIFGIKNCKKYIYIYSGV